MGSFPQSLSDSTDAMLNEAEDVSLKFMFGEEADLTALTSLISEAYGELLKVEKWINETLYRLQKTRNPNSDSGALNWHRYTFEKALALLTVPSVKKTSPDLKQVKDMQGADIHATIRVEWHVIRGMLTLERLSIDSVCHPKLEVNQVNEAKRLITISEVATRVGLERKSMTGYSSEWGEPAEKSSGSRPARYDFDAIHPILKTQFPDHF